MARVGVLTSEAWTEFQSLSADLGAVGILLHLPVQGGGDHRHQRRVR